MMKKNNHVIEEIRRKIHFLKLKTKKIMHSVLLGDNKGKTLGNGLMFSQTREYQHGDDIRFIDWNAYARTQTLVTKQYIEEQKKKVFILSDISTSTMIDTALISKHDLNLQITMIIMLASVFNSDTVGSILYADDVILRSMPSNKISEVSAFIEKFFTLTKQKTGTQLKKAVETLLLLQKKNPATVIIVSDFIDETVLESLPILARYYDVYAVRTIDPIERELPQIGFLRLHDIENGNNLMIDTRNKKLVKELLKMRLDEQLKIFKRHGISVLDLYSDNPNIISTVIRFLLKSEKGSL